MNTQSPEQMPYSFEAYHLEISMKNVGILLTDNPHHDLMERIDIFFVMATIKFYEAVHAFCIERLASFSPGPAEAQFNDLGPSSSSAQR